MSPALDNDLESPFVTNLEITTELVGPGVGEASSWEADVMAGENWEELSTSELSTEKEWLPGFKTSEGWQEDWLANEDLLPESPFDELGGVRELGDETHVSEDFEAAMSEVGHELFELLGEDENDAADLSPLSSNGGEGDEDSTPDDETDAAVRRADADFARLVNELELVTANANVLGESSEEVGFSQFLPIFTLPAPSPSSDTSVAIAPFNALRRLLIPVPVLNGVQSANAIRWNARHPTSSGVDPNHIRMDLARYVNPNAVRTAIQAFNQQNPSVPVALGTPPIDAVFVESVHQFQAKCYLEKSQVDGLAGESTLDSLGLLKRRGMNSAARANTGAVGRLREVSGSDAGLNGFTADNWFDSMVNPSFLGWRFTKGKEVRGVHLTFMRKLRKAERALLEQPQFAGMTPVELGRALGFSETREEYKGARPGESTSRSMHTYGLAVDILYSQNPWVRGREFTATLKHAALLVSGAMITEETSAQFFDTLPAGRTTQQVYDVLGRRNQDFRSYLSLDTDLPELTRLLQQRRAVGTPGVFASTTETVDQAARRWLVVIRRDRDNMRNASSPFRDASKKLRDPSQGFLNLPKELVVALRDEACLAWGAVDIGPGPDGNGDMMHFDARVCGLGDQLAQVGRNFRVERNHHCLPCATRDGDAHS